MAAAGLAALLAAAGGGPASAERAKPEERAASSDARADAVVLSPAIRALKPANAEADRTYPDAEAALLEGDLDWIVMEAHRAVARGDQGASWRFALFADAMSAGDYAAARAVLRDAPGGLTGAVADLMEPFLLGAEGRANLGAERVNHGADDLPSPLPDVARALVYEGAGELRQAGAIYTVMAAGLDTTPPGDGEPDSLEDFQRALGAARTTHSLYRAALVQHRLGNRAEARSLYNQVAAFAPHSADIARNLALLDASAPPFEAALDANTALGRWMFFLSEYVTQSEGLVQVLSERDPDDGLTSDTGALLLQLGLALAPDADDWRLYAAGELSSAGGYDGAQMMLDRMSEGGVFAAEAEIARAGVALERGQDSAAAAAAGRALNVAGERWPVIASAGDIYRQAGRSGEAIAAFDRALSLAQTPKDRADVLGWRAFAHRYSGDLAAATADMRAAYALDQGDDTRLMYISILMDDPNAWRDGIQAAREFFAEQPDSVTRLNALGYALIQHPEGLEEGYRLLWRGFNFGQRDYAVIDSLGWAYYLYGHFEEARALIERARDLSAANPNPEVLDHLGDIYWRLGRREDARAQWRLALEERPDALRRADLEQKISRGLRTPAPARREPPDVNLPEGPRTREET